jgi:hypothetical protein
VDQRRDFSELHRHFQSSSTGSAGRAGGAHQIYKLDVFSSKREGIETTPSIVIGMSVNAATLCYDHCFVAHSL